MHKIGSDFLKYIKSIDVSSKQREEIYVIPRREHLQKTFSAVFFLPCRRHYRALLGIKSADFHFSLGMFLGLIGESLNCSGGKSGSMGDLGKIPLLHGKDPPGL